MNLFLRHFHHTNGNRKKTERRYEEELVEYCKCLSQRSMENVQLHWHILWIIENPTAFVHSTYSIRLRLVHRQSNSHEFCWKLI